MTTPRRILEPGIYLDVDPRCYHADPAPDPSLSSSIAELMISRSPRHAFLAHARLNPSAAGEVTKRMDFGSVAHTLLLGKGDIVVLGHDNYLTKAAKVDRDIAREEGKTPILAKDFARAEKLVETVNERLAEDMPEVAEDFARGASEAVLLWRDGSAWCRAMIDKLVLAGMATIYDIKVTGLSARPDELGRQVVNMGYDLRAAFYMRGLAMVRPAFAGRIRYRWLFIEDEPPHAVTIAELDGAGLTIGAKKAATAVALWESCIASGDWPLWHPGPHRIEYPAFAEAQWLAREMSDPLLFNLTPTLPAIEAPARQIVGAC